jgi:hypothetical protein
MVGSVTAEQPQLAFCIHPDDAPTPAQGLYFFTNLGLDDDLIHRTKTTTRVALLVRLLASPQNHCSCAVESAFSVISVRKFTDLRTPK